MTKKRDFYFFFQELEVVHVIQDLHKEFHVTLWLLQKNPATKFGVRYLQTLALYLELFTYTSNKTDLISSALSEHRKQLHFPLRFSTVALAVFEVPFSLRGSIRIQRPALWENCGWVST